MKFTVNRDVFSDAVSFVVKLLPQRTTLPLLSGALIEADGSTLTFSSFDYEVSARTEVSADIEVGGRALVSGRLLNDIANKLPQAPVIISTEEGRVQVKCGSASFSLPAMPVDEYPTVPSVDTVSGLVPGDDFAAAISQVSLAASKDDVTPVITGVQFEINENNLSLIATDRYRVAVREIDWENSIDAEQLTALVPARIVAEVGKTFAQSKTVSVAIVSRDERELISFSADRKTVTSLLIKGNFPPVRRLFPETVDNYAVVNTNDLIEATNRVGLVLEREAALRFSFVEGKVTLEAAGSEAAQASETIDVHLVGDDTTVSLKPQFLLDGLRSAHSEYARISFTKTDNPNKPGPVLITSQTSKDEAGLDSYKYLLQPNLLLR
ncbi:DNA polymerase III subunit beta [Lysinibacter sp. HNR]|uniref:DNA polymerase III subunit beta n=1 Tax=Lysinibacter sp. HNR TaxID=3031408 RepID=UPI002434B63F|nr:DNA polymerase III subunit beta [Lysinibacter sp. HNR]WGD37345.1 DNA polymerase III subunit beta [Lysinibacter sp. HNR]